MTESKIISTSRDILAQSVTMSAHMKPISGVPKTDLEGRSENAGDSRYLVEPVMRAIAMLNVICTVGGPLRLKDVTAALGLSKATAFRHLRTLQKTGLICHDTERNHYRINLDFAARIASAASVEQLRQFSLPHMERLGATMKCTVNLGVLEAKQVRYVEMVDLAPSREMRARIAGLDLIHTTAIGKAILAHLPQEQLLATLPPILRKRTQASITDRKLLMDELEAIRTCGYAEDRSETEEGFTCIGAPLFGSDGTVVAAISLSTAAIHHERWRQRAISALKKAATAVNQALG